MMPVLLKYFPRQLSDVLLARGAAMLVVGAALSLPLWFGGIASPEADTTAILGSSLDGMSVFLVMIVTYGITGEDVRRGYYRFLFAKPINPIQYYGQALVAALIVFLIVQLIMIGIFALAVEPVWPGTVLRETTALFVLLGSVIFAVSRLTRLDWLVGMTLLVLGSVVRGWFPAAESLRGKIFNVLLPPVQVLDSSLFSPDGIDWGNVAWVGGYAAVCIAIGLGLLRFIPFSTNR